MTKLNPHSASLQRSLPLPLVTFYGISTILGAGIYVLVGKVAGYAGMYTPFAFIVALFLATFSAFSYAELSARYPLCAGEAVYIYKSFNNRIIAIFIGLCICLGSVTSVATLLHGVVGYLSVFFQSSETVTIIALALLMGLVVAWGITESVSIASLMACISIAGLLLIIWITRDHLYQLPDRIPEMLPGFEFSVWEGILIGGFVAFYAFLGFEDIINVAEEVHNPERNLPLAIILALIITTLLYLAISVVCILSLPANQLAESNAPLALIYSQITGTSPIIITLISLVSILDGALVQIIKTSRILYGMSRQGWLPDRLGIVNAKTRTPIYATFLVTSVILLFALSLPLINLAKLSSFITLFVFTTVNFSLWRLKSTVPRVEGVFTVPYWVPVIGFFISAAFVLYQLFYLLLG